MKRTPQTTPAVDSVSADDVANAYVDGVARIDADRTAAYAGLGTLSVTKSKSLERERTLLTRKYGDQHPRVLAVQERIRVNTVFGRDLAVAHTSAATPAPVVDENGYVLHGHVRDSHRKPLPRLTVALYDAEGQWLSQLGYSCTDDAGYFVLRYEQTTGGNQPTLPDGGLEIRVYDASQKLLHRESKPLRPELGAIHYREIIICDEGTCTPPPGAPDNPPPKSVTVPDLIGKTDTAARSALKKLGLGSETSTEESDADNVGRVIAQDPKAGSLVPAGSVVRLAIGAPRASVAVPDLSGLTLREATNALKKLELALGKVEPAGAPLTARVVQQSPAAGKEVDRGTAVDVVVETPREQVTVPSVVGNQLPAAKKTLDQAGLKIGRIQPADAPDNSVVAKQAPDAGSVVDKGTAVDLDLRRPPTDEPGPVINPPRRQTTRTAKKKEPGKKAQKKPPAT